MLMATCQIMENKLALMVGTFMSIVFSSFIVKLSHFWSQSEPLVTLGSHIFFKLFVYLFRTTIEISQKPDTFQTDCN